MQQPLLTTNQVKILERKRFCFGQSSIEAMEAAGTAVVTELLNRLSGLNHAIILVGPGNNGGDGFVIARQLQNYGKSVQVGCWSNPECLKGDALVMRQRWGSAILSLEDALQRIGPDCVVIDALFGIGFNRPVGPEIEVKVRQATRRAAAVVAVDIPSGIDADTGRVVSDMIVADFTVTFGTKKLGHVLEPGRSRCGEVLVAPIDLGPTDDELGELGVAAYESCEPRLPRPGIHDHKYSRGHVWVASGGLAATGAARLAARAALRIGAGVVSIASPREALSVNAHHLTAVMLRPADTPEALAACMADERSTAMLIGPGFGIGARTREAVLALLATGKPLVLDADALTSFENKPETLFQAITGPVLMTPHEGEFRRLFPMIDHAADKLTRVREAARLSGAVVLLKGPDTVIAAPDGVAYINSHASPELATAGSGDVLAGTILGLIAQQRQFSLSLAQAAMVGAWIHGEAGLKLGPGLIAEDLPETYPAILKQIACPGARR